MITRNIKFRIAVQAYCIREKLFTCGSVKQYDYMLEYAELNDTDTWTIATMIQICSDTTKTIRQIQFDLEGIYNETLA